jgi:hypothetical protein
MSWCVCELATKMDTVGENALKSFFERAAALSLASGYLLLLLTRVPVDTGEIVTR